MSLAYEGPNEGRRVFKYHVVIMFPQLPAKAIYHCSGYASLVGSLTVGNELDDLVRQIALTYINVRNPLKKFLAPYDLVVQHVEKQVLVSSSEGFKMRWGI